MKNYTLFILLLSTLILIIFNLSQGLIVDYQRNSGPELIILLGKDKLLNDGKKFRVNYSECAYTTYQFDTNYGFENIGISFVNFKLLGSQTLEDGDKHQIAALLEIKRFYPVYLVIGVVIINLVALTLVSKRLLKSEK